MESPLQFRSKFLSEVIACIKKRHKALRSHGNIHVDGGASTGVEWIEVRFEAYAGNRCIFQFTEGNRAAVFVRKKGQPNRGQTLFSITDVSLVSNGISIVAAMERTILDSGKLTSATHSDLVLALRNVWSLLEAKVHIEPVDGQGQQ